MALSRPVIKAQDFICCQLCESETKIKWKCLPCDLLMCDNCRDNIHPKIQNAKNHQIINVKEVGLFTEQYIDFTNIKCKQHQDQDCCIFCSTCNEPVCTTCIAKAHSKHNFLEIKEVYRLKKESLVMGQQQIQYDKAKVKKASKDMDELLTAFDSRCGKASQYIQSQRDVLVKKIDQYNEKFKMEVEQKQKAVHDLFSGEKTKLEKTVHTLDEQNEKAEEIMNSKDTSNFFDVVDDVVKSMENTLVTINIPECYMIKFIPGDINQSNVGQIASISLNRVKLELVKEFLTEVKTVNCVLSVKEDLIWIADFWNSNLQKVKKGKQKIKTISTYKHRACQMELISSNDILLSTGESTLKWINTNTGKLMDSHYSVKPWIIVAFHITHDNKIITAAVTSLAPFPPTEGKVVVMNKNGEHQMEYQYDQDNKPLFTWPGSLTSTRNGQIAVIDQISVDATGRSVILSERGDVINIYSGHPEINTIEKTFTPTDIVTSPGDNIIVTDYQNSLLHVLDYDGQFIKIINTLDNGIQYPHCLAYNSTGLLYIGCDVPFKSSEKAKIYEVVLSEC